MALVFKVWDITRKNKAFAVIYNGHNNVAQLISAASEQLGIDGHFLTLESDGTPICDDKLLLSLEKETLMLFRKDEKWSPSQEPTVLPTEMDWTRFEIPWEKISNSVIEDCIQGAVNSQSVTEVVNTVVDAIREIDLEPPSSAFKAAAGKIIAKFPAMLGNLEQNGRMLMVTGLDALIHELRDRNGKLNEIQEKKIYEQKRKIKFSLPASRPKPLKTILSSRNDRRRRSEESTYIEELGSIMAGSAVESLFPNTNTIAGQNLLD